MSKLRPFRSVACGVLVAGAAPAVAAARCDAGPAIQLAVTGFKARTGTVRVQLYGGNPARWFDKGTYLRRIELPAPRSGPLDLCVAVPAPGTYAISVRHDLNGSGKADRGDGGGLSGNPHVSLFDLLFKRKPVPGDVAVPVSRGVKPVAITLDYLSGTSFRPVAG